MSFRTHRLDGEKQNVNLMIIERKDDSKERMEHSDFYHTSNLFAAPIFPNFNISGFSTKYFVAALYPC